MFCYWGHRAAGGGDSPEIVAAASSLELLHTFALIHDDVMDRSPRRRGLPATHVELARDGDAHFGVSSAILAGDLALTLADEAFRSSGFAPAVLMEGLREYNIMRAEVVAGQYLDLAAANDRSIDEAAARRVAALKSGGYTVARPLRIGAALAGGDERERSMLAAFGEPLGEAFQLRDDVLGAFGDPEVTGKDTDGDLREGKRTFLVIRALAAATPGDRTFLDRNLGRDDLDASSAERIRRILRDSGALEGTLALIGELRARALDALARADLPLEAASALAELVDLAVVRES
jgi:geranylgeranyl diphosphate synthase type I